MTGYEDIIDKDRPVSKRARMSVADRAKIFSPFAALKGFEEAIEKKNIIIKPRTELSEEEKEELDVRFNKIEEMLNKGEHPIVTVIYFIKARDTEEDICLQKTGIVAKVNIESRYIQIVDEKISFEDLYSISGEML